MLLCILFRLILIMYVIFLFFFVLLPIKRFFVVICICHLYIMCTSRCLSLFLSVNRLEIIIHNCMNTKITQLTYKSPFIKHVGEFKVSLSVFYTFRQNWQSIHYRINRFPNPGAGPWELGDLHFHRSPIAARAHAHRFIMLTHGHRGSLVKV